MDAIPACEAIGTDAGALAAVATVIACCEFGVLSTGEPQTIMKKKKRPRCKSHMYRKGIQSQCVGLLYSIWGEDNQTDPGRAFALLKLSKEGICGAVLDLDPA